MKERYGHLTVVEEITHNGYKKYRCLCDCGNETIVYRSNLLSGRTKSCGCGNYKNRHKYKNLTNKTFGKLVAIKPTKLRSEGTVVWECQCLCGRKKLVSAKRLLKGDVKSCGCLKRQETRTCVEGTVIECLTSKLPKNNTSGVKGVYRSKEKWIAYITLKKKEVLSRIV
ncbi:AP2 domain-containing protein [Enterococcus raffinosus]|uniref:AP2 domain-containing protein n=1 Tax=Enterococcus raffinosus TaxID=71452 RepID=UPI0026710B47|nr:AP2 domain-containing protein [Enterococcus raffinosus]